MIDIWIMASGETTYENCQRMDLHVDNDFSERYSWHVDLGAESEFLLVFKSRFAKMNFAFWRSPPLHSIQKICSQNHTQKKHLPYTETQEVTIFVDWLRESLPNLPNLPRKGNKKPKIDERQKKKIATPYILVHQTSKLEKSSKKCLFFFCMTNFGIKKKATQRHLICGQDSLHWAQWNQQQVWWWLNLQWLQRINQPGSVVPNGSIRSSLGAGEKVEAMEDNYKQKKLNLSKRKQALKTGVPKSDFCWKAIRFVFEIRVLFVFFFGAESGRFFVLGNCGR